jgi:hypothetical protein
MSVEADMGRDVCVAKIDITRTELVWPGKYNEDGTRKEVPRVESALPGHRDHQREPGDARGREATATDLV